MPVESAADRALFLAAADFGVTATYTALGQFGSKPIQGIFDAAYADINLGLEIGLASVGPRILVASADLVAGGRQGDLWVINATNYKSSSVEPDGTGMTNIKLLKA